MEDLTISISDERAEFLRRQAEARGASVDDYLDGVLAALQAREATKERLRALLIEGGPAEPWTREDRDAIEREIYEQLDDEGRGA